MQSHPQKRQQAAAAAPPADHYTPADRYKELFVAVQAGNVFPDSKTFVDCAPRMAPQAILEAYRREHAAKGFDLRDFVHRHFMPPRAASSGYVSTPGQGMAGHIDALWPVLTRQPLEHPAQGSALPLPHPYVVPGGRFGELYYWDSYFTMLGLAESGYHELVHAMTDNFAYLIDTFGFVPNGTRTYYLSRSQPPVFALMTQLCEARGGQAAVQYLPQLLREHAWWMEGAEALQPGDAVRRVVALPQGAGVLNRYWDERDTPREESWREDVATATGADRPAKEVYRDLRAAAESGWDFSTRWLREPVSEPMADGALATICTTHILPVDLNAFLWKLEQTIARMGEMQSDQALATRFASFAAQRQEAMQALMWSDAAGAWFDYDWQQQRQRSALTAATAVPLFTGLASAAQAQRVAATLRERLLAHGGLATTEYTSGQQWDRPNGWAPLQWMAVQGLEDYGHTALAQDIRQRWLRTVREVFAREGRMVEKYTLREVPRDQAAGGSGGEYPLQDGFGWTNGVTRRWLHEAQALK